MASEVNGTHRERWKVFLLPGVITGPAGDASLFGCAGDVRTTVSAWSCTKHFSKGLPPGPSAGPGDCGVSPRPGNSSVPPTGPSKRRDHASGRSQLGPGSAGGQPTGRCPSQVRNGTKPAQLRRPIQAFGVGACDAAASTRALGPTTATRRRRSPPGWPQLGR